MKKVYECGLFQASKDQGYIVSGNCSNTLSYVDERNIYSPDSQIKLYEKESTDVYFDKIMVTQTSSKYFVKEIRTGKIIPVVCSYHNTNPGEFKKEIKRQKFPFGKVHTYIVNNKYVDAYFDYPIYSGMDEVIDPGMVEEYLNNHENKEKFLHDLDDYFNQGKAKMMEKFQMEAIIKETDAKNKVKIKKLLRK